MKNTINKCFNPEYLSQYSCFLLSWVFFFFFLSLKSGIDLNAGKEPSSSINTCCFLLYSKMFRY